MVDKVFSFGGVKCGSVSQTSNKTSHFSEQKTTQEWTPLWLEFEKKKNVTWLGLAKGQGFRLKCEMQ